MDKKSAINITGLTGLRDYGTGKGLNIDWTKDTGAMVNGQKVDTSGLTLKDGRYYGSLDQLNTIFAPFLTNTNKDNGGNSGVTAVEPYKSPFETQLKDALDKVLNFKVNPYDANSDPSYASYKDQYTRAGDEAFKNAIGNLTSLTGGRLNTWATSSASQAQNKYMQDLSNIIPQLEQAYNNRQQNTLDNLYKQLGALQGLDSTSYNRNRDSISDSRYINETSYSRGRDTLSDTRYNEQKAEAKTDKEKQTWIDNIGQFYGDVKAEINKVTNDGDPSNDWQIPYLKNFREQKINTLNTKTESNQEKAKADAIALWQVIGTATPEIAKILGVPKGARTADYQNMLADNARLNSGSGGNAAGTTNIANLGTATQVKDYYYLHDLYMGGNGGVYAGDPYKALNDLRQYKGTTVAAVGDKLYKQLENDLLDALDVKDKFGNNGNKSGVYDYKTDPDFIADFAGISKNMKTALSTIKNNSEQLIKKYGLDGYNALVDEATQKETSPFSANQ